MRAASETAAGEACAASGSPGEGRRGWRWAGGAGFGSKGAWGLPALGAFPFTTDRCSRVPVIAPGVSLPAGAMIRLSNATAGVSPGRFTRVDFSSRKIHPENCSRKPRYLWFCSEFPTSPAAFPDNGSGWRPADPFPGDWSCSSVQRSGPTPASPLNRAPEPRCRTA